MATRTTPHFISNRKHTWEDWEQWILVDAQTSHKIVSVILDPNMQTSSSLNTDLFGVYPQQLQSIIIGFDTNENELLLDGLHPLNIEQLAAVKAMKTPFWVQVKSDEHYFNLLVKPSPCDELKKSTLISAQIIETFITDNRRWNPRIHFPYRGGPKAEVFFRDLPRTCGVIENLSQYGLLINIYGHDIRKGLNRQESPRCHLQFNEQFEITVKLDLKQCRYQRYPCCHNALRATFRDLSLESHTQLNALIYSLENRCDNQPPRQPSAA